jgi:hypothetical protein
MEKELNTIKTEVFKRRPVLQAINERFGKLYLNDYVLNGWQFLNQKPEEKFLQVFQNFVNKIYGPEIANKASVQLQFKPLLSTVDHHGIWNHPIFVNSTLLHSLNFTTDELVIVLGTESVSLNNSCWAGSLLYHNQDLFLERSSFFTDKEKMQTVYKTRGIEVKDVERVLQRQHIDFKDLFKKINFALPGSFSQQAVKISSEFWKMVFPSAPSLLYLPLESLVVEYLLTCFQDLENIFSKIILSSDGRKFWKKYFGHEHTFMFWGLDEKGRRTVLTSLPENSLELIGLLRNKEIYPASPLCYCVLLYSGLACAGGFTQTTWLTSIKENFLSLLKNLAVNQSLISQISLVPTQNFAESSLAWLKMGSGFVEPSAVDLYLTNKDYYPVYKNMAKKITLEESLNLAMPEIYNIVVPKAEHDSTIDLNKLENEIIESLEIKQMLES